MKPNELARIRIHGQPIIINVVAPHYDPRSGVLLTRYQIERDHGLIICDNEGPELSILGQRIVEFARHVVDAGVANAHLINDYPSTKIPNVAGYINRITGYVTRFQFTGDRRSVAGLGLCHTAPGMSRLIQATYRHGWNIRRLKLARSGSKYLTLARAGERQRTVRFSWHAPCQPLGDDYLDVSPGGMPVHIAIAKLCEGDDAVHYPYEPRNVAIVRVQK
jgi:hypothetical protein